jgi:hypothetical protein
MGAKKQTIGYRYFMSILSGLCRGPINEFVAIQAADKTAWEGAITENSIEFINKPQLFGGEKKEGGLQGPFSVFMGAGDQVLPGAQTASGVPESLSDLVSGASGNLPSVKASIGTGLVSEFRGVVTLWFDGFISAMNPYIKEWRFRVRRWNAGWWQDNAWYPEKALILLADGQVKAMNGAHIIYECCTNPQWGRGLSSSRLDENSFVYAANTLCGEMFGLCIAWYRKEDIDVFIKKVLDLIGGVLYTDRETGLVVLRLVRDDYIVDDLPLFTPESGLLDIQDEDSGSSDTAFNEIIGTGRSPIDNKEFQIRAQNLASFQAQQDVASMDQDYRGVPTKELVSRLVTRDLRANAVGLKKYRVVLDRRGWRIAPGMPFRISDPKRGIAEIVLRAGEIDDGNMLDGRINIKAVQDVFGLPSTSFVTITEPGWTPPPDTAETALETRLIEAGYRDVYLAVGSGDAETGALDSAYIGQMAIAPNTTSYQYDLATKADGEADYEVRATGSFTGNATLVADITPLQTEIEYENAQGIDGANVGEALLIGDEVVRLDAVDELAGTLTVARGAADTVPQAHVAGARIWTLDDDLVTDQRIYMQGETVFSKVLTRIATDVLSVDDADEESVELVARQGRPYPPADVQVDGDSVFQLSGPYPEPVLTWVSRNRITQADVLLGHTEASVSGEALQNYNIRVYDPADLVTPIRTVDDLAALTWTYDAAMQTTDGDPSVVVIELESVRGDVVSWQRYQFTIAIVSGWGDDWGFNWGGGA